MEIYKIITDAVGEHFSAAYGQEIPEKTLQIQKTRKENRQKLEKLCDALEADGISAKPHVYIGDTVSEIDKAARECQSSMIVAGSPKKSLWKDRWGTSISKELAEKSIFPILLIPPTEG